MRDGRTTAAAAAERTQAHAHGARQHELGALQVIAVAVQPLQRKLIRGKVALPHQNARGCRCMGRCRGGSDESGAACARIQEGCRLRTHGVSI